MLPSKLLTIAAQLSPPHIMKIASFIAFACLLISAQSLPVGGPDFAARQSLEKKSVSVVRPPITSAARQILDKKGVSVLRPPISIDIAARQSLDKKDVTNEANMHPPR